MRTTLLIAFVAVLFVACGSRSGKNSEVPAPLATDTNNICSKIDTVSAKVDTAVPQKKIIEGIQHVVCHLPMGPGGKEWLDSVKRERKKMDSLENVAAKTHNEMKEYKTDSVSEKADSVSNKTDSVSN